MIFACGGQGMLLGWMRPSSDSVFSQIGYMQNAAAHPGQNLAYRCPPEQLVEMAQDWESWTGMVHGRPIEIGDDRQALGEMFKMQA